jgi:hypothetical protein
MGRWQDVDFNNPTKDDLFNLCMDDLKGHEKKASEINIEAHRDILVKYDLQQYNNLLVEYQLKWFYRKDIIGQHLSWLDKNDKEELPYRIEISKILKMFLSKDIANSHNLEVIIAGSHKIYLSNNMLFNQFREVFIKEFERLALNETEYTTEEALEEIKEFTDTDWFYDYGPVDCCDGLNINSNLITEELINDYKSTHYKQREISLELVNHVIEDLELYVHGGQGKVGAKIKNLSIGELAKRLSYLHKLEDFLNQTKYISIEDFPLSNETCRLIYEYFDFWGLLYHTVKFSKSEKGKRANYIRSMIRNNENLSKKGIFGITKGITIIDKDLELRIDLFKKVKDGAMVREEFLDRMEALQD